MAEKVQVGNIGTVLRLTVKEDGVAVDVSGAIITKQILIGRPNGTTLTKTAAFTNTGTDGKIQWTTIAGDLSIPGWYRIQARLVLGTFDGYSEVREFFVYPNTN